MKKTYFLVIVFLFISSASAEDNVISNKTALFAKELLYIYEQNPSEKEESNKINAIFVTSLNEYLAKNKLKKQTLESVIHALYRNGLSEYSDSPERRRMRSRRALCFASIAMLGKMENRITFIKYAQYALIGKDLWPYEKPDFELLEKEFLGYLFLEMLIKRDNETLTNEDLLIVRDFINIHNKKLGHEIINTANGLLNSYRSELKE